MALTLTLVVPRLGQCQRPKVSVSLRVFGAERLQHGYSNRAVWGSTQKSVLAARPKLTRIDIRGGLLLWRRHHLNGPTPYLNPTPVVPPTQSKREEAF